MFSFFTRKISKTVKRSHLHDPTARPAAPILLKCAAPRAIVNVNVHWWNEHTVGIFGVFSPTPNFPRSPDPSEAAPPFGFSMETGASYFLEHSGEISWSTIWDTEDEHEAGVGDGDGEAHLITSPSGSIVINGSSSPASVIRSSPHPSTSLFDSSESGANRSNLSDEDRLNFPVILSDILMPYEDDLEPDPSFLVEMAVEVGDVEEALLFGVGCAPRRASTITKTVGRAIKRRRNNKKKPTWWRDDDEESFYFSGPHVLQTIEEEEEEE